MEKYFILVGVGIGLYYSTRFIFDAQFAERYAKNSPQAFFWRKTFGEEKTKELLKYFFGPFGILVSLAAGIYALFLFI